MKIAAAIAALLLSACGAYYYFLYPPSAMKRAADQALQQFAQVVESKDRAKIGEGLKTLLTDDAKIHLEVNFVTMASMVNPGAQPPPMAQDFDKASFMSFIDNILYSLTDYAYAPKLEEFALAPDGQNAAVHFTSKDWGDGNSYWGGTAVNMRFSTDTDCHGSVRFIAAAPQLAQARCILQLRTIPKPGELQKLQGTLREQLR